MENKLLDSIDIYQSSCWHCHVFGPAFVPIVERGGLRCRQCNELNQYDWSEDQYKETLSRYKQNLELINWELVSCMESILRTCEKEPSLADGYANNFGVEGIDGLRNMHAEMVSGAEKNFGPRKSN